VTVPMINSEKAACVTSEREEIVMTEQIIVPTALAELDYAKDAK
jgi:hypothetical protein